jgi:processive 1,2-diacylglycerol beta-glucosyltransferase
MSPARVLVLSGSAGHGHVRAGEAVADALRTAHPALETAHRDALELVDRWYARAYRWTYLRLVDRHPLLWRWVYGTTDRGDSAVARFLTRRAGRGLLDLVARWKPHAVVCTHFLAPELLGPRIAAGRLATRLFVVVTDHDIHRAWYAPGVAGWFVASEVVKARLVLRYRVPPDRIRVTGIPVRAEFAVRRDPRPVRMALGLDPSRPAVLFLTAGFAAGDISRAIEGLWVDRPDAQILAVCGKNERLRRRVEALPRPAGAWLKAEGFVERVWDRMAVADVVVSKSGGITTAECLAMGRPLVVSASIPGQEERNADALLEAGAAVKALTPEEVRWRVGRILADSDLLLDMAKAARIAGRPNAAFDVAAEVARGIGEAARTRTPTFHGAF